MNRLWVRLSLTIAGVIVFLVVTPLALRIATRTFGPEDGRLVWRFGERFQFDGGVSFEGREFRALPGHFVLGGLLGTLIAVTLVSIVAGVLASRSLTAPLNKLAAAAKAIGAQQLSRRVDVNGSAEVRAVASAFNEMAAELERAEALRSNLLADVAHELRTPLTVIQGNLRAILDDVYGLDKEEIARLYDQTRHLTRLVDDLRELAQAEAQQLPLELTGVDVASLVDDTATVFRPIAEAENVELRVELAGDLAVIRADRARLTQSLHNLLTNALRHTPSAGAITLRAARHGGWVELSVQDTGAGLMPEHLAHVFDRFYRTDEARDRDRGGAGLGLAIVKAIVEAHGGAVRAESGGIGHGSTFIISLPLHLDSLSRGLRRSFTISP